MLDIKDIEIYAKENYVPIARKQTIEFILNLMKERNYTRFLEIGTAIGYTSINVALLNKNINVVTIEHDSKRAEIAKKNFIEFGVNEQINMIEDDAVTITINDKFDLIFIDASKKRNDYFLDKFSPNLNEGGMIIIDNMKLEDFWVNAKKEKKEKFHKMNEEFKKNLLNRKEFDVQILEDIGDGIALIKKKNEKD
ncbi:MAG: class I SAM-dependent methyltransferase [Bacillales bacterium]|nr:class I SAM-dependent methyltransferase [Erysipelotrichaceae bacterium]MDD6250121.1 class I SAM-dependent methyltransferase [Bacillales bacterium]MDD7382653.1 class I SAM-dependent methyltransferase [Bacillales bacterium]